VLTRIGGCDSLRGSGEERIGGERKREREREREDSALVGRGWFG